MTSTTVSRSASSSPDRSSESATTRLPLQGNYWFTVAFVLLALCPDLFISTSLGLLRPTITRELHASVGALGLADTFSNAGWAFGAVLAADLAQRFPERWLVLLYEGAFVVGSALAALAPSIWFVVGGHILQGIATGMLLVAALPPLITQFPVERIRTTAAVIAIGLFGGVAAGPLIGGYVAHTGTWHWFFASTALLGTLAFVIALLLIERKPGYNPGLHFDAAAIGLALVGGGLAFYGAGELAANPWTAPIVWVPTVLGVACIVALIVYEYRASEPLMPVKALSTTIPIIGIVSAIMAGLAFTGMVELLLLLLAQVRGQLPLATGLYFWPTLLTAIVASLIFGLLFTSRFVLVLPLMGLTALAAAAALLIGTTAASGDGRILLVAALLGVGAGLSVSPGLFVAGLSVSPKLVGRAFALVEMLRLAGAFAFVPVFISFAQAFGTTPDQLLYGMHLVFWVILGILVATISLGTLIWVRGGARIHTPDLNAYLVDKQPALDSPAVNARANDARS